MEDGIHDVEKNQNQKGWTEVHSFRIGTKPPKAWVTSVCSDPFGIGCTQSIVLPFD